ncbi:MAG: hypothetical protein JW936_06575 [Sedimentisphaerales bacterium]|nr:hypothetical protein [Sedimentisphaerales bacterium]
MKLFYILILLLGIIMAVVMQFVTIAVPRDAFVASTLSRSPDQWSIQMDESMASHLSHSDVKAELVTALQNRAQFRSEIGKQNMWQGLALIAFSVIGIVRERKIQQLKNVGQQVVGELSEDASLDESSA